MEHKLLGVMSCGQYHAGKKMTEWEPNASVRVLEHLLLMALAICLLLLFCVTSRAYRGSQSYTEATVMN